jgi:GntR family transcriptional regulator
MTGPLYRKITDDLRRKIESGELEHGIQLPTEDHLMESYRASRNTVRSAIKELTTRGLVDTLHGRGTFVSQRVSRVVTTLTMDPERGETPVYRSLAVASGRSPSVGKPDVAIRRAGHTVARNLGIPLGADVIIRSQKLYLDDRPWALQTSFYPRSLLERAPRLLDTSDIKDGTVDYMAGCGIRQAGYRDEIEWRLPNGSETAYFDLPADGHVQVVEVRRMGFGQDKNRVRLTVTVYRADRNLFAINVGDVPMP